MIDLGKDQCQLAPAYDLISARLVITEKDDPEELVLTLNDRKRNFKLNDFLHLAISLGLKQKQRDNIFNRFQKAIPAATAFIDHSFLPEDKKIEYKELIQERAKRLWA